MSLSLQQLKTFQTTLESRNDTKQTAEPVEDRVVAWAMIEIVILLTAIKDHLTKHQS
jgi:hypothetical protein